MRKLSIFLALAAAFSLAACNSLPWTGGYPPVPTDASAKKPVQK